MKNSYYFDHDYNARNDAKILELRAEHGWAGYGIYFALIECLCESQGEIKRGALGGLSLGLSLPKGELQKMIDFMIQIELLNEEDGVIFSKRVKEHISFRTMLSEAGKRGGRGNKKPPLSPPKAPPEAGKERKEKEIRVEEKREDIIMPYVSFEFKQAWQRWKDFKKTNYKFTYKTVQSEQTAVKSLADMAGSEQKAIKIIDRAIMNGYQGLFNFNETTQQTVQPVPR